MHDELLGALALVGLFAALIGLAEALARLTRIDPEWSRKLVHLGGGFGCLLFPWLVDSPWTVLGLALGFGFVFWWAERRRWLLCLCRVSRQSRGSLYYPFAVAGLFWASADRYGLYAAAVLVLTVSDTAAALVGSRYGRIRYRTGGVEESKSLEGSLAFWGLSFLLVYLPLRWGSGVDPAHAAFAAFLTASLLTAVEAVAVGGRDNLYVPILAAFVLLKVVTKPAAELAVQSVSMVLVFGLMILLNRYGRILRTKGLMIVAVLVYGAWSLGSADWAVPLLAAFAAFALVFHATGGEQRRTRAYRRMAVLAAPSALLVLAANVTGAFSFAYGPFLVAVLVPLVWAVALHLDAAPAVPRRRWSGRQAGAAVGSAALVLAGPVLMRRAPDPAGVLTLAALSIFAVWLGLGLTLLWPRFTGSTAVIAVTCVTILLTAGGQTAGWLACWRPTRWADVFSREADVLFPLPSLCPEEREDLP